jgi:rRNA processing protein Gar1
MNLDVPFWIWLVVAGIVFSAYMTIRTNREEKEIEMKEPEMEGAIYIERMEREKEKRKQLSSEG